MSFSVSLYTISKKPNSTKTPTAGALVLDGTLKESTTIQKPSILFDAFAISTPIANYMYIEEFSRYYYINSWTWELGLWRADCEVDVLASYKSNIANTNLYILRTSWATRWDNFIIDGLRPTRNRITRNSVYFINDSKPFKSNVNDGNYVVGIVGKNANSADLGIVSYYVFTPSQFKDFMGLLFDSIDWMNLNAEEITESLGKALINPYQYIVSCMWFPFQVPTDGSVSSVNIGWWERPISCGKLSKNAFHQAYGTATLQSHPQSAQYGRWLNSNPYTRISVYFPPFGVIALDASDVLVDNLQLQYRVIVDLISGVGTLYLTDYGQYTKPLKVIGANVGVPIQTAQMNQNLVGALTNAGGAISSVLTGNVLGATSGIVGAISNLIPQMETSGYNGGFSTFVENPTIVEEFVEVTEIDDNHVGRPSCTEIILSRFPSALNNYFLFSDGDISAPCTHEESQEIKRLLESGIFYE